jgi:hypothetical protein
METSKSKLDVLEEIQKRLQEFQNVRIYGNGKTPLQSRFTLLKSKFFPAKFSFYKIRKKNLQKSEFIFAKMSSEYTWNLVARNNYQPRAVGKN